MNAFKRPISVLVVIYTYRARELTILMLERRISDPNNLGKMNTQLTHSGDWQSVTGSLEANELPLQTAMREVAEETGIIADEARFLDWQTINTFEIFEKWRHRYAPGVIHNREHVFSLEVGETQAIQISPQEHSQFRWLPWKTAAEKCFSWSNQEAILRLARRA